MLNSLLPSFSSDGDQSPLVSNSRGPNNFYSATTTTTTTNRGGAGRVMRARAGSIRLPLYSNGPTSIPATNGGPKLREKRTVSPDSAEYRSAKPHSFGKPPRGIFGFRAWVWWATRYLSLLVSGASSRLRRSSFRYLLIALILLVLCVVWLWEIQVEIYFYSRRWIDSEVTPIEPLAGCFNAQRVSSQYNLTKAFEQKAYDVQAGISMRMGLDCYDFAATIPSHPQPPSDTPSEITYYHTYWRTDLAPFRDRQECFLKSFFATQDLSRSILILWSNGHLPPNPQISHWLTRYPEAFQLRVVNFDQLAAGTALEGSPLLGEKDSKAWVDGDLVRLLVVWAYGGVWVDLDSLLTRDLRPLFEHEFVTQWDCYDKKYRPFNGALLHFKQYSPYLCEAFHIMTNSPRPKPGSVDWGSLLYHKLWRRLIASGIQPFKILPFCFSDGRSCRLDNRLPDPFLRDPKSGRWPLRGPKIAESHNGAAAMDIGGALDNTLQKVFSVHLHNQWEKSFPVGGWVDRLLISRYDRKLNTPS